ncbi:hypothetical protein GO009_06015 [Muricauda sp. TY007]|uniref:hypothetical protein n=1 Tax=Allomuricauda sp. TY007 TaxID=2683200 RepID=UPI0013C043E1|nr:hypothetical protein [Muricauda sp. TY007]NDV15577.1 hypothetical protein [Muricauda sp. TY007]
MEMMINGLNSLESEQFKDRQLFISFLRKRIESGTGSSIESLREENSEERLFYLGAYYVTTTKKALCEALDIPIEAACRYKRAREKDGVLKQSEEDVICPVTRHPARLISTNPKEFKKLHNSNQLKIFTT